ncbi:MAG TPA: twin-arginine translocase TatA/TatE family subunit [Caulobacteraceae bacterium]|jgi:sec-independent protein translocase protein TatA|nr:twin-arginine translocase TatA/TatE family subunit [Caulobacteraceae bacterium]
MGTFSPIHLILLAVVVLLLFGGRGKLSGLMGDAAKGIRAFRDGLKGEEAPPPATPPAQPLNRPEPEKDTVAR